MMLHLDGPGSSAMARLARPEELTLENLIKKQASNEHFNRHLSQIGENSSGYNAYFNRTNVNAL